MKQTKRTATTPERLREAMADAGKKQIDLAQETGLSHSTISRYLSGRVEPRQEATHKLAQVLNVSEMWLWGYDVPKERTPEQKKNDDLVKVVAKLRNNPDLISLFLEMAELSPADLASIRPVVSALRNK